MKTQAPYRPRLFRYLWMCGITMALAWGIRGQIGHERGAMLAGILGSLAVVLVTPDCYKRQRLAWLCFAGGIGLAVGGSMSYGTVAGSLGKPGVGLLCTGLLLLKGAVWGGIGGGFLGMAMGNVRYRLRDALWLGLAAAIYLPYSEWHPDGDWSRGDNTWGLLATSAVFLAWLWLVKRDRTAVFTCVASAAGFGIGFPLGSWLCVLGEHTGIPIDWWKVAEMTWGLCGGLSWGLAVYVADEDMVSPGTAKRAWPMALGVVYAAWFVPLWNGLNTVTYWAHERQLMPTGVVAVYGVMAGALLAALVMWMLVSDWRRWDVTLTAQWLIVWISVSTFLFQFAKMAYPDGYRSAGFYPTQFAFVVLLVLIIHHVCRGVPREQMGEWVGR